MPKALTEKDVLYALQYGGESLVRTQKGWRLASGAPVPKRIAEKVRAQAHLTIVRRDHDGEYHAIAGVAA